MDYLRHLEEELGIRLELEPQAFDLLSMLQDIGLMFEARADSAQLSFKLELDPALVRYIKADAGKPASNPH
jgi:signal transduction histidine kinase